MVGNERIGKIMQFKQIKAKRAKFLKLLNYGRTFKVFAGLEKSCDKF